MNIITRFVNRLMGKVGPYSRGKHGWGYEDRKGRSQHIRYQRRIEPPVMSRPWRQSDRILIK